MQSADSKTDFLGMKVRVASDDELDRIRDTGQRIETESGGFRVVSFFDKARNELFVVSVEDLENAERRLEG